MSRWVKTMLIALTMIAATNLPSQVKAAPPGQPADWGRYYYYPYVYYPHNFRGQYKSYNHMYYRYNRDMQIPVYNKSWYNFYPSKKPYHWGNHFKMDIF